MILRVMGFIMSIYQEGTISSPAINAGITWTVAIPESVLRNGALNELTITASADMAEELLVTIDNNISYFLGAGGVVGFSVQDKKRYTHVKIKNLDSVTNTTADEVKVTYRRVV